jgi:hypothetical protein
MKLQLMTRLIVLIGASVVLVWIDGNVYGAVTPAPADPGTPMVQDPSAQGTARPAGSPTPGAAASGTLTPPAGKVTAPSVGAPAVGGNLSAPNPQQPPVGGSLSPPQTGTPPAGGKLTPPNAARPPIGGPVAAPNAGVANPGVGVGAGARRFNPAVGTNRSFIANPNNRDRDNELSRPRQGDGTLQRGTSVEIRAIPSTHGAIFTTNSTPAAVPNAPNAAAPK